MGGSRRTRNTDVPNSKTEGATCLRGPPSLNRRVRQHRLRVRDASNFVSLQQSEGQHLRTSGSSFTTVPTVEDLRHFPLDAVRRESRNPHQSRSGGGVENPTGHGPQGTDPLRSETGDGGSSTAEEDHGGTVTEVRRRRGERHRFKGRRVFLWSVQPKPGWDEVIPE